MTNDPLNLDEAVELAGLWWLPDEPGKRIPGILRYDGEGSSSLSLIGAFEDRFFRLSPLELWMNSRAPGRGTLFTGWPSSVRSHS